MRFHPGSRPFRLTGSATVGWEMKVKDLCSVLVVLVLGLSATSCILGGRSERARRPGELDRKLDAFTYLEEGKLIALAAGTEAARYRDKDKYFPVALAVANKGAGTLMISRESFTLQDENGKRYAAVPASELNVGYNFLELDRNFTGTFSVFLSRFSNYERLMSNLYPTRSSPGIVIEKLEVPRFYHIFDWLYFPRPTDGVLGHRFELHMDCPGLEEGVFVKFIVN